MLSIDTRPARTPIVRRRVSRSVSEPDRGESTWAGEGAGGVLTSSSEAEVILLRASSRMCCCCSADSDTSDGRENVTDVRADSCESVRDIGNVEFSGELETVCVVTAVVGLASGMGNGVVSPRMVAVDDLRRVFLSCRLLVDLRISDSEGKVGRGGGTARAGIGLWRFMGTLREAGVGEGS